jgi:hypothetical protein
MLDEARVPVLWRPYHEMNGDWFWWGGRVGEYSTIDLYRQLYERLVNFHHLNNLVWVWNVDRPSTPIRKFSNFYPGNKYLDIVSLDVYGADFNQAYYDSLMALSQGKPLLFGEVGNPPSLEILKAQPNWTSWVIWAGFVRNTTRQQYQEFVHSPRMLFQEDQAYWQVMEPFRKACGMPALPLKDKYLVDFSGQWMLNEAKSEFGNNGPGNTPYRMNIEQDDELVLVKKFAIVEWGDDRITNEEILLDGTPMVTRVFNTLRTSSVTYDDNNQSITIISNAKSERAGRTIEMKGTEVWNLLDDGRKLKIVQTSTGFRGETNSITLFYERN